MDILAEYETEQAEAARDEVIARWESYRAADVKAWADRLFGVTS
jgi:hypothetical protein